MAQVFVRLLDGKTAAVDVAPTATIADLRTTLIAERGLPNVRWRFRTSSSGPLDDGTPTSAFEGLTLQLLPPVVSLVDNTVVGLLHQKLGEILRDLDEKTFLFIGLGSYDNDHGLTSIKRQQCRDAMFDWCAANGWRLIIVLVDPAFASVDGPPQIYDVANKGWYPRPAWETDDHKVRQYINLSHPLTSVWTFATGIREYDPLRSITDPTKIEGVDVRAAFENAVRTKRRRRCCLVMGNFYGDDAPQGQYTTWGDFATLQSCGFTPTG